MPIGLDPAAGWSLLGDGGRPELGWIGQNSLRARRPSDYESVGNRPPSPNQAHPRCSRQVRRPRSAGPCDRMRTTGLPEWLPTAGAALPALATYRGRADPPLPPRSPARESDGAQAGPFLPALIAGVPIRSSGTPVVMGPYASEEEGAPCPTKGSTRRAGGSSLSKHHQPSHLPNHPSSGRRRHHHRTMVDRRSGGRRTPTRCGSARDSGWLPAASAHCCWWWDCSPNLTGPRRRRRQPRQPLHPPLQRPRRRQPPPLHRRPPSGQPRFQAWWA
jgi:hypothetical protein